jgi:hypothetical protein
MRPAIDGDHANKINEPQLLATFNHRFGDVNELQFLTSEVFVSASSDGSVSLLRIVRDNILSPRESDSTGFQIVQANKWDKIHSSKYVFKKDKNFEKTSIFNNCIIGSKR